MSEDYEVLYILARNDLDSLNPGKLAAQVAHAATQLSEFIYNDVDRDSALYVQYKNWIKQAGTFGTVITLAASKEQLDHFFEGVEVNPYEHAAYGCTIDPTYPFIVNKEYLDILSECGRIVSFNKIDDNKYFATRREHTCSWIFGMKSVVSKYVEGLQLYK